MAGVLVIAVLVWVSLDVWTAPVGMVWHLFHGRFTSFEGHKILVPWDMWAEHNSVGAIDIIRTQPDYPIARSRTGVIMIQRVPVRTDMTKVYDRVSQINGTAVAGYKYLGLQRLQAPRGAVYCWEQARLDSGDLYVECWFDNDTLAATYAGSPTYREDFYDSIKAVSGASANSNER